MRISLLIFSFLGIFISASDAKCLSGNCTNGKGTYLYSNGVRYTGDFIKGKPNGIGSMIYKDGTQYNGRFVSGKMNGYGILKYSSGNIYSGNFINDIISGYGILEFVSGDKYSGNWSDNRMHGQGTYRSIAGWIYDGRFKNGVSDGYGRLRLSDGSEYAGAWYEGLKQGEFEFMDSTGNKSKIWFTDDVYTGPVSVTASGKTTSVTSLSGNLSAKPTTRDDKVITSGTSRVKNCNENHCNAETGYVIMDDGSVYYGEFKNGIPDGKGKVRFKDGVIVEGQWKNRKLLNPGHTNNYTQNYTAKHSEIHLKDRRKSEVGIDYANTETKIPSSSNKMPQVHALIAGVSSYKALPSLRYTDDDAYRFYAFLKSPEGGALSDDNMRLTIDELATSKNILNNLNSLAKNTGTEDALIIYLSGHGLDGGFVPHDFDGSGPLMHYETILGIIKKSKAKYKLVIADACHSGSLAYNVKSPAATSMHKYYTALSEAAGGTAILVSSALDEVSLEYGGIRQGIFSHFLIRGLKGEADNDDNGIITLGELYAYISANVSSYTAGKQNPVLSGIYDDQMPVASVRR